jgi:hypothetical protein
VDLLESYGFGKAGRRSESALRGAVADLSPLPIKNPAAIGGQRALAENWNR